MQPVRTARQRREGFSVSLLYFQKAIEELIWIGTALNCEEIYDLNEKPRLTATGFANCVHQLFQTGNKTIMPNSEQRATGNIPNAGRLDHQGAWPPGGKTPVPFDICFGYKSIISSSPGHHRRHPGAAPERQRSDSNRLEKK